MDSVADKKARCQWRELAHSVLPALADRWMIVNFFAVAPKHLQGSVLLALTRKRALLLEFTTGSQLLLLKLKNAAVQLQRDGKEHYFIGQCMRYSDSYFLALAPAEQAKFLPAERIDAAISSSWRHDRKHQEHVRASAITDYQWEVPPGPMQLKPLTGNSSNRANKWFALEVAHGTEHSSTIAPDSSCRNAWDWAWRGSYGAAYLTVYLARSAQQIREWLQSFEVHGFRQVDDDDARWQYALPGEDFAQALARHTSIVVFDGGLQFCRGSYLAGTGRFDGIYLRKLAAGELGELSFDLFDGDYVALNAVGYSCASLFGYLNAPISRSRHRAPSHRWNEFKTLHIEVPSQADIEESVRVQLNQELGVSAEQDLRETLAKTPIAHLPRYVTVLLPWGVSPPVRGSELNNLIGGGFFSRICWRWLNAPNPV
jgi:hypothetical protein